MVGCYTAAYCCSSLDCKSEISSTGIAPIKSNATLLPTSSLVDMLVTIYNNYIQNPPSAAILYFSNYFQVGKYQVGKTIGEGTFGKVKLAVNTETGERMAIKVRAGEFCFGISSVLGV